VGNNQTKKKNGSLTSAAVGAAVGVGIGAAAAALANPRTRKTLQKKASGVTKKAGKTLSEGKAELNKAIKGMNVQKTVAKALKKDTPKKTVKKNAASKRKTTKKTK
jgi:hypothetical protein